MIEVTNKSEIIPENDLHELWQQNGRINALVDWLHSQDKEDGSGLVYVKEVLIILGK